MREESVVVGLADGRKTERALILLRIDCIVDGPKVCQYQGVLGTQRGYKKMRKS